MPSLLLTSLLSPIAAGAIGALKLVVLRRVCHSLILLVIYAQQQLAGIGDCVRELELLANAGTLEDFENRVEFLPS